MFENAQGLLAHRRGWIFSQQYCTYKNSKNWPRSQCVFYLYCRCLWV